MTVDAVIVSFNSRDRLRRAVEPLAEEALVQVVVVDNASTDGSLETLEGLPVTAVPLAENGGFAVGCNVGWRRGSAPFVLFLNPDAVLDPESLRRLVTVLEADPGIGVVAPRIDHADGSLDYSQRRFPRLIATYARALFLHRAFPRAAWADELVRDPSAYERSGRAEWVSGACMLVRREALEELGGFDERFFLFCEDQDLCRRVWQAGYEVRYEPEAVCVHDGGGSAPRSSLLPVTVESRLRYAAKYRRSAGLFLERVGLALHVAVRMLASSGGLAARAGHARSLRVVVSRRP